MADTKDTVNRYNRLISQLGKTTVSAAYPNDIEVYLCAFELVDSKLNTEAYFAFPIQPSSIQKVEPTRTTIKKSLSGTTILKNSSFIPQELSLKGNFGRKFKILNGLDGFGYGNTIEDKLGSFQSVQFDTPEFSYSVKTGYGCIKLLQKIFQSSQKVDKYGKSKSLVFYNLGFGESYLVTIPPTGFSFSQTEDQNMIWSYQANLTIIAPLVFINDRYFQNSSPTLISSGNILKRPTETVKKSKNVLEKYSDFLAKFKRTTGKDIELFLNDFNFFSKIITVILLDFLGLAQI